MNKTCKNVLGLSAALCMGATLFLPTVAALAAHAEEAQPAGEYVLTQQTAEYSEDLWATAPSYDMTPVENPAVDGATGSVKILLLGSKLYYRATIQDATRNNGDSPMMKIVYSGKTWQLSHSRYLEVPSGGSPEDYTSGDNLAWPNWAQQHEETEISISPAVTYLSSVYTYTAGYDLGTVTNGAIVSIMVGHADAQENITTDGIKPLDQYAHKVKLEHEFAVQIPGEGEVTPPEEPEITDYSVPKIDGEYSESVWESAREFPLKAAKGTPSYTASVKTVIVGSAFYFRLTANDPTKLENDTPTMTLSVGNKDFKLDRAKYLKQDATAAEPIEWIRETPAESHLNMTTKYENGAYVFTSGYELSAQNVVDGCRINFAIRHCDATEALDWADNDSLYENILAFDHVVYAGRYTETDPTPPPVEYPTDPEPTEGPENTDLKIVLTDIPKMPLANESSWANVPKYDMIKKNGNSEGATGTIQIVTCDGNLLFRVEIHDDTIAWGRDGRWIEFGNEEKNIVTRGNYDTGEGVTGWLAHKHNDFGEPSLCICETTLTEGTDKTGNETTDEKPYGNTSKGVYVYYFGYQIRDNGYDITPGNTIHLLVTHNDSLHKGHAWEDGEFKKFHTIYFDQVLTFGEPADTTIRPETPTQGFAATLGTVEFNKATIGWNDVSGAELYRLRLYKVNAEGSEEPYTFVKEETVYGGEESYEYTFEGLDAETKYIVQVLALNDDEETVAASSLVNYTTLKQGQTPGGDDKPEDNKNKGCGSVVGFTSLIVTVSTLTLAATVIVVAAKKKQK